MLEFWLCAFALIISLVNVTTMRVVGTAKVSEISESVDILTPMRNEENNVEACVMALLNSEYLTNSQIHVLDDSSTDTTWQLLDRFKVNKLTGTNLPEGWLGKNWACHKLAMAGSAEYLVFVDADVRLHPYAIASGIGKMQSLNWEFISPYPKQLVGSFMERLIQPLLQWSWMASVPLRIAEASPRRSTTIANGQFFIITRKAYEKIGGHEAVASEVLDDLELARALVAAGFRGGVADGSSVATCRMYENSSELISGYTKSLWRAFGGAGGTFIAIFLLVMTGILPYLGFGAPVLFIFLSRVLVAIKVKSSILISLLHPLAIAVLLYLIALSFFKKSRGTLQWRGRKI